MSDADAARIHRNFRIANLLFALCAPLWVPCLVMSKVFFTNDRLYELAVHDPETGTSLTGVYRREARKLEGSEEFRCTVFRSPSFDDPDRRDQLLQSVEWADSASASRELSVDRSTFDDIIRWVEKRQLFPLRRGTAIAREYSAGMMPLQHLKFGSIESFCLEQEQRRKRGMAELPPLEGIHEQVRGILLRAADNMDAKLAAYADVRPWLLAFFYAWIAYSLLGFACAFYGLRLARRYRELLRPANAQKPSSA